MIKVDRLPRALGVAVVIALVFTVLIMVLPLVNVVAVSLSSPAASENPGLLLVPAEFSLDGYRFLSGTLNLGRPFLNTVFVSVTGTLLHGLLAALGGYVLSRPELPYRTALTSFVLLTMTVPGELTLVSIYVVNKEFGLINTYAGLIVNGAVSGFSILLLRNYFEAVPRSLVEAARIDGCGDFTIFRLVFLPLSPAGLATVATLELVRRWNNIALTVTLISDMDKTTLPVVLRWLLFEMSSTSGSSYVFANAKMAAVVVSALPLVLLYAVAQKFFVGGMSAGAVKG